MGIRLTGEAERMKPFDREGREEVVDSVMWRRGEGRKVKRREGNSASADVVWYNRSRASHLSPRGESGVSDTGVSHQQCITIYPPLFTLRVIPLIITNPT